MSSRKLHESEADIDAELVARLISTQFPQWAHLPLRWLDAPGTVHVLYRLGDDMVVRLPRAGVAAEEMDKEFGWLPRLAPRLPAAVPLPLGRGVPGEGYPHAWSVYRWLEGENPVAGQLRDPDGLARDLAAFIGALRGTSLDGAPPSARGRRTLAGLDAYTREWIGRARGLIDVGAATNFWEAALRAPAWDGVPVWVHADLLPGNVLVQNGRLSAVIDFGSLGSGDPASDLSVAWSLLPAGARQLFREQLAADDATWARARGLAFVIAIGALAYYQHSNPVFAAVASYSIREILAEQAGE